MGNRLGQAKNPLSPCLEPRNWLLWVLGPVLLAAPTGAMASGNSKESRRSCLTVILTDLTGTRATQFPPSRPGVTQPEFVGHAAETHLPSNVVPARPNPPVTGVWEGALPGSIPEGGGTVVELPVAVGRGGAKPSLRFPDRIQLIECCKGADAAAVPEPIWLKEPSKDPYFTRLDGASATSARTSSRLRFEVPRRIEASSTRMLEKYIPPPRGMTSEDLVRGEVKAGSAITPAGAGGFSDAYFVHPEVPDELLRDWKDGAEEFRRSDLVELWRGKWAREHATEVLKIRRPSIRFHEVAQGLLRDQALEEVAVTLAEKATYEGKKFIRVARWKSSPEELVRGVIRQEVMRGPTVAELEAAARTVESSARATGPLSESSRLQLDRARELLARSGLSASETLDRIVALEDFYRQSHRPVRAFVQENRLLSTANVAVDRSYQAVGLDYNHGRNAAWDPDLQQFVLFDW